MEIDVTKDRDKYVGGSDIPAIMNISPFKTRWQLLLEKAEPATNWFPKSDTTREIEYGNTMEPKIRAYMNSIFDGPAFYPNQRIVGDLRANVDGWDGEGVILEIKTTSVIHQKVRNYKYYVVQLLFYMMVYEVKCGVLAVYHRPEDFNEEFDKDRLQIFYLSIDDYDDWIEEIEFQLERFRYDLERVKANPLLTEQDLQPNEVIEAAKWVINTEAQLAFYKMVEVEHKKAKAELKAAMQKYGIKKWITNNGTKITLVPDGEDYITEELDMEGLRADLPELFNSTFDGGYMKSVKKKGKSGYVRITTRAGGSYE